MTDRARKDLDSPEWKLHDAKARFSELFRRVRTVGPQRVVKRGGGAVVIIDAEEYERMRRLSDQPERLVDFFAAAPTGDRPLELHRKRDPTRDIEW